MIRIFQIHPVIVVKVVLLRQGCHWDLRGKGKRIKGVIFKETYKEFMIIIGKGSIFEKMNTELL